MCRSDIFFNIANGKNYYQQKFMRKQYLPSPVDTGDVQLPDYLECLTEKMARNVHEVWAEGRMKEGWRYGPVRDDAAKTHPCLVSYDELPESEREYDRQTAVQTLKLILKLGYNIVGSNG